MQGSVLGQVFHFPLGSLFVHFIPLHAPFVHSLTLILPATFEGDVSPVSQTKKPRHRKLYSRELKSHSKLGFESGTV